MERESLLNYIYRFFDIIVLLFIVSGLFSCKDESYIGAKANHERFGSNRYVGASTCIECHKEEYASWKGSHHEQAMQIANDSNVLGDFNNVEATIDGVAYFFYRENNFNTNNPTNYHQCHCNRK